MICTPNKPIQFLDTYIVIQRTDRPKIDGISAIGLGYTHVLPSNL